MKLRGVKIQGPNVEVIIIPRGDDLPIVLRAQAILDMDEFNRLCPEPEPPKKMIQGGQRVPNVEDPHYMQAVEERGKRRLAYMVIKSLSVTEGLEWERVRLSEPSTWLHYLDELKESGFNEVEVNRIINGVHTANCLNESKIDEARQRFLAWRAEEDERQSSQMGGQSNGQSGEPVNGSASSRQVGQPSGMT